VFLGLPNDLAFQESHALRSYSVIRAVTVDKFTLQFKFARLFCERRK